MPSLPQPARPQHPACDLCGHQGPGVRFYASEGAWLCRDSRACTRRFHVARGEWEAEHLRYEPVRDEDIPF
jgi:hypothetical protein